MHIQDNFLDCTGDYPQGTTVNFLPVWFLATMNFVQRNEQFARAGRVAGRMVGKYLPKAKAATKAASKQWGPSAAQSKQFIKHVLPATVKPVHALWHEILGFIFLAFAGIGGFRIWQRQDKMPMSQMIIVVIFVAVMAGYGISSVRKARKISKS